MLLSIVTMLSTAGAIHYLRYCTFRGSDVEDIVTMLSNEVAIHSYIEKSENNYFKGGPKSMNKEKFLNLYDFVFEMTRIRVATREDAIKQYLLYIHT